MTVGVAGKVTTRDRKEIPRVIDEPFKSYKNWNKELKPTAEILKVEVLRRYYAYYAMGDSTIPRPKYWSLGKSSGWLDEHPVPGGCRIDQQENENQENGNQENEIGERTDQVAQVNEDGETAGDDEIEYICSQVLALKENILSQNSQDSEPISSNHFRESDYLRLYHVIVVDDLRDKFSELYVVRTREQIDARNSVVSGPDFFTMAAEKFNDGNWSSESLPIPDVHENFSESKLLPLRVPPISADDFKRQFVDCRGRLVAMIARWKQSGSGANMKKFSDDEEGMTEDEIYEFKDGDDRKAFLNKDPPHILYLWHLSRE
jgi:hypothetical protein